MSLLSGYAIQAKMCVVDDQVAEVGRQTSRKREEMNHKIRILTAVIVLVCVLVPVVLAGIGSTYAETHGTTTWQTVTRISFLVIVAFVIIFIHLSRKKDLKTKNLPHVGGESG